MAAAWLHPRTKLVIFGLLSIAFFAAIFFVLKGLASAPPNTFSSPSVSSVVFTPPLTPLTQDADGDGFPDAAQLKDAEDCLRFRRWFCALTEAQYYRPSPAWEPSQRDCAGLLRYAYKEALRKHDPAWRRAADLKGLPPMPDVSAFNYPQIPLLGEKLFRISQSSLNTPHIPFAAFADAQALKDFNLAYRGKERAVAQEGDILIFYRPENPEMPYHLMVYLTGSFFSPQEKGEWLVYHTGPVLRPTRSPGEVRRVSWAELQAHPDPAWHPASGNPNFLGFYRWRILKG